MQSGDPQIAGRTVLLRFDWTSTAALFRLACPGSPLGGTKAICCVDGICRWGVITPPIGGPSAPPNALLDPMVGEASAYVQGRKV